MAWVLDRLGSVEISEIGDEPQVVEQGAAKLLVRVSRRREEIAEPATEWLLRAWRRHREACGA